MNNSMDAFLAACDEGPGICAYLITFCSIVLIFITLPVSLCFAVKVVQEYERVVIFRLGRLLSGGARGPGIFFIVPCVDSYQKVDMRTLTFDVPPQEVSQSVTQSLYTCSRPRLALWLADWTHLGTGVAECGVGLLLASAVFQILN